MSSNDRLRQSGDLNGQREKVSARTRAEAHRDRIELVGDELLASYKLIDEAWQKAEATLALAHVPVDVQVHLDSAFGPEGDPEIAGFDYYLEWCKVKSQWRICYVTHTSYHSSGGDEPVAYKSDRKPISECSVDIRLAMFEKFPQLYEKVIEVSQSYVPKIVDAVKKFDSRLFTIDL